MSEDSSERKYAPLTVYTGRKKIYSNVTEITRDNVVKVINEAMCTHLMNVGAIKYLWNYYKGLQPILNREKEVRPEINNKVVENHAQECVAFKLGYQLSDPVQYVSRGGDDEVDMSEKIKLLNDIMYAEDKESLDYNLFETLLVDGICPRIILPDVSDEDDEFLGGGPFEIFNLDPQSAFVIYSNDYRHEPIAGVYIGKTEENNTIFNVYTKGKYFAVVNSQVIAEEETVIKFVPIIEYELNSVRMGVFEPVLPILDAINGIESNRLDGVEQTVQSLMKFVNCDVSEEEFVGLLKLGAIKVTTVEGAKGDVEILKNDLDQTQTQVTKEDLYRAFINITGMPSRSSSNGSDTGAAVVYRSGWTLAETHAHTYELRFCKSERELLRIALQICSTDPDVKLDIKVRDIDIKFNRRNYDNLLTKSQVLTTMLSNGSIHPLLAFQSCGMFTDPEAAYLMSMKYVEEKTETSEEPVQEQIEQVSQIAQPELQAATYY